MFMADFTLFGITAPMLIWIASAVIASFTFTQILWLELAVSIKRFGPLGRKTKTISALRRTVTPHPRIGLDGAVYDRLRNECRSLPLLKDAWNRFEAECLETPDPKGGAGVSFYRTRPTAESFSESAVVDSRMNRAWFLAVPGIVTGVGLLVTFVAILMALMGLKVGEGETVVGIKPLITGLSGKFLSSIVALVSATVYTFFQTPILNRISIRRRALCAALDDLVPRRDVTSLMAEVANSIAEQTAEFKNFGTGLSMVLQRAFSHSMAESIAPQQERMVAALEGLNTLLEASESSKQESMTGELAGLLRNLESSLTKSIGGMGERFTEALSGSASRQMGRAIDSLGAMADLLEKMNAQSQANQAAIGSLTEHTRQTTIEQMALGKSQVEDLSATLKGLMLQLNESAGTSVNRMSAALTAVVHDLTEKVGALGVEVSNAMLQSSGDATGAAKAVIDSAGNWSARSEAQLHALLTRLVDDSARAEQLRNLLDSTLGGFQEAVALQGNALRDMREVSTQMATATAGMSGVLARLREQDAVSLAISQNSTELVTSLEQATTRHQETWSGMLTTMEDYAGVFRTVDLAAAEMLQKVGKEVGQLSTVTEAHFKTMITNTDNYLGDAVKKLGGSVAELSETLDDLSEILGKARKSPLG